MASGPETVTFWAAAAAAFGFLGRCWLAAGRWLGPLLRFSSAGAFSSFAAAGSSSSTIFLRLAAGIVGANFFVLVDEAVAVVEGF